MRAAADVLRDKMHILLTAFTPAFSLLLGNVQRAAFRQRAAAHQFKTEGEGAGLHAGKRANLQPHAGDPARAVLPRLLLNNFQRPLA